MSFNRQDGLIERPRRSGVRSRVRGRTRARLIEANLDLVVGSVGRVGGRSAALRPDLMQEGTIALICAVDRFEEEPTSDFPDYARQRIDRRIRRAVRRRSRERTREINQPMDALEDLADTDPFSFALHTELGLEVEAQLRTLSALEECVLRLRFGIGTDDPQTLDAIARRLGVRLSRVAFLLENALSALRRKSSRLRKFFSP